MPAFVWRYHELILFQCGFHTVVFKTHDSLKMGIVGQEIIIKIIIETEFFGTPV